MGNDTITTPDGVRSIDAPGRLVYLAALVGVVFAGFVVPGGGFLVALVLGATVFEYRSGDATRLHAVGLLLLILYIVMFLALGFSP